VPRAGYLRLRQRKTLMPMATTTMGIARYGVSVLCVAAAAIAIAAMIHPQEVSYAVKVVMTDDECQTVPRSITWVKLTHVIDISCCAGSTEYCAREDGHRPPGGGGNVG
jgi:hypothetical protein